VLATTSSNLLEWNGVFSLELAVTRIALARDARRAIAVVAAVTVIAELL
jgi:hypothetical protein